MHKKFIEKNVKAWWGNIALVTWGNPANPPVLLVHGYMDTAATFVPLMDQMSDEFYYVGFDMPGHGKSDPFPPGILISRIHIVEAMRHVVEFMKWNQFVLLAHSMGCIIGLYYHQVFPGKIRKMILLDPLQPISLHYLVQDKPAWFKNWFKLYYDNFEKFNSSKPRLYTYQDAISLLARNRCISEEQAGTVLSRSLIPMGIDSFRFSWEPRMKKISSVQLSEETLYSIMTTNMPPTLSIDASETKEDTEPKRFAENVLKKCDESLPYFHRMTVIGGHDVHVTHSQLLAPSIETFLRTGFEMSYEYDLCKL